MNDIYLDYYLGVCYIAHGGGMLEYFLYLFQYQKWCFCGNTLDLKHYPKKPEKDCHMPCKGNTRQICGGSWRNSIYYQKGNSKITIRHFQTLKQYDAFDIHVLHMCISSNEVLFKGKLLANSTWKEY